MTSIIKVNEIQDAGGNTILSSNGTGTFTSNLPNNTPAFQATISGYQTPLNDNTVTKLNFTVENYDTNNAYDAPNSKFTVPSGQDGKYLIISSPWFSWNVGNTHTYYYNYIYKNGSSFAFSQINLASGYLGDMRVPLTITMDLSAGDYIEVYGNATGGTSWGNFGGFFEGFKIIT